MSEDVFDLNGVPVVPGDYVAFPSQYAKRLCMNVRKVVDVDPVRDRVKVTEGWRCGWIHRDEEDLPQRAVWVSAFRCIIVNDLPSIPRCI